MVGLMSLWMMLKECKNTKPVTSWKVIEQVLCSAEGSRSVIVYWITLDTIRLA